MGAHELFVDFLDELETAGVFLGVIKEGSTLKLFNA